MRRGDYALVRQQLSQHLVIANRFLAENIERHSRQAILIECVKQRLFVDQPATRAVNQPRSRLEQVEFARPYQPARTLWPARQRGMQRHKIGLL